MFQERCCLVAELLAGQLFVCGGAKMRKGLLTDVLNSSEHFDFAQSKWIPAPAMSTGRAGHGGGSIAGKLYICGGCGLPITKLNAVKSAELLDPRSGVWTSLPPMPVERCLFGAVTSRGYLYVVGGLQAKDLPVMATTERERRQHKQ